MVKCEKIECERCESRDAFHQLHGMLIVIFLGIFSIISGVKNGVFAPFGFCMIIIGTFLWCICTLNISFLIWERDINDKMDKKA